ncbi:hypothetical protein BGX23_003569, partial [Mortierella sp. AD031]
MPKATTRSATPSRNQHQPSLPNTNTSVGNQRTHSQHTPYDRRSNPHPPSRAPNHHNNQQRNPQPQDDYEGLEPSRQEGLTAIDDNNHEQDNSDYNEDDDDDFGDITLTQEELDDFDDIPALSQQDIDDFNIIPSDDDDDTNSGQISSQRSFQAFLERLKTGKEPTFTHNSHNDYIRIPDQFLFTPAQIQHQTPLDCTLIRRQFLKAVFPDLESSPARSPSFMSHIIIIES